MSRAFVPPEVTLRAPTVGEVGRITDLINSVGRDFHGKDVVEATEVEKWFTSPTSDPDADFRLAELADGTLAGFGSIADVAEDHAILWLRVTLHPEHGSEEIGAELLRVAEARAQERGVPGHSLIHANCSSKDERVAGLYERHGYRLVRHFFRMQIDLHGRLPGPVWPEGIELRPVDPERDLEAIFAADDEAFEDHWGYVRISFDAWTHWQTQGHFDPTLWFIAYDGDEIAGFSLCEPEEGGDPDLGWVGILGVRRPWRRRGLGLALLRHSFVDFKARGATRVGLGVDAENTTGAVRLYERAGMHPVRRNDTFEKAL